MDAGRAAGRVGAAVQGPGRVGGAGRLRRVLDELPRQQPGQFVRELAHGMVPRWRPGQFTRRCATQRRNRDLAEHAGLREGLSLSDAGVGAVQHGAAQLVGAECRQWRRARRRCQRGRWSAGDGRRRRRRAVATAARNHASGGQHRAQKRHVHAIGMARRVHSLKSS